MKTADFSYILFHYNSLQTMTGAKVLPFFASIEPTHVGVLGLGANHSLATRGEADLQSDVSGCVLKRYDMCAADRITI